MQAARDHENAQGESSGTGRELTLRALRIEDIPQMVQLAVEGLPQLPNYRMITPVPERIEYLLRNNIQNAASTQIWVMCDAHTVIQGGGGGWCVPNLLSYDMVADDIFMWIRPEYRTFKSSALLIRTYLDWAKARGAKLIRASHTGGSWPKGSKEEKMFSLLLQKFGFKEGGTIFHYSADVD